MKAPKNTSMKIEFSMEAADRSVGIMAEGFSAWKEDATAYCNLVDIALGTCEWIDGYTGLTVERPHDAPFVEAALVAWAEAYYEHHNPESTP